MASKNPEVARIRALKSAVSRRGSSLNASIDAKNVRLQLDESFERENGYSYDYVIVFKVHEESAELTQDQKDFSMRKILQQLAGGGIETKMFYSVERDLVFCKLRATLARIGKEADRIDYKVEFDPMEIQKIAEAGYEEQGIGRILIQDDKHVSKRGAFDNIFAKYDTEERLQVAYRKYGHKKIPFRGVDRIKLLLNIIKAHITEGGCALNLNELETNKCIVAAFPLHNFEELAELKKKWFSWKFAPWGQPLVEIKDYFGEKVGLYFAWLGHYTTWLIMPSLVGILVFLSVIVESTADSNFVPYFGLFMALWSTFYYEYWKRYNSTLALEWGMSSFEDEEVERPEFEGEWIQSPVDGSRTRYFSPQQRFRRIMGSLFFVFILILLVIGCISGIFIFRYAATNQWKDFFTINGTQIGGPVASTINAVQIMILNNLYSGMASKLNNFENHRTDTEFEDHLIGKTFLFQFVNSYASLFYVAFIKSAAEGKCKGYEDGCMDELMMGLGIIFVLRLTSGNFFEVGLPWIKQQLANVNQLSELAKNAVRREPSEIERQMRLDVYDQRGTFDDYNEMIIQFGYVTLFVVGFPLAPALALLNNFFEIRIDAHKLVHATRRPDPRGAQDIGTWGTIIEVMSSISVVTNVALVCFTSKRTTHNMSDYHRLWLFVGIEHGLIMLKYLLMMLVDDEPSDVTLQKQRAAFIVDKIVNLIADDDDAALAKGNNVRVDLTVFDEDL
uniref:Anoctamin transmembrane domain-containing protein n=1 Tax=Globisporangium ultimum (strain ATCC 200006 / CBS 805.95 / DAOM BR144) TaxID=431595 RepID=K3W8D0_GLOUD